MIIKLEFSSIKDFFNQIYQNLSKINFRDISKYFIQNSEIFYLSSLCLSGIIFYAYINSDKSTKKFNKINDIKTGKFYFLEGKVKLFKYY